MEAVTRHSVERATDEAVRLWSFASAQYPIQDGAVIQAKLEYMVVESASAFAFNARRSIEILDQKRKFKILQPRYEWKPMADGEVVETLWDALNYIIHSREMTIGFEQLPVELSIMLGGTYVIPYIRAKTDERKLAFVDIFALSHCFLYDVLPELVANRKTESMFH